MSVQYNFYKDILAHLFVFEDGHTSFLFGTEFSGITKIPAIKGTVLMCVCHVYVCIG